jgi:hypothetical protein
MSPQKVLFCYHLSTQGRAWVKLGDAWYVSNVSIIFDAPSCLCTICFVFCYTSWRFYAFSGTNLLTRCHSASSLFSAVFVFQKSYKYSRNWTKRSLNLLFFPTRDEVRRRAGGGLGAGHTMPWHGWTLGRARLWCGPPWCPLTSPLHLFKVSVAKTLNQSVFFEKEFRSPAATTDEFQGTEVSVPAPCQDGEVPPKPPPSTPPPSPSTSPPSPSMLLSPMMRRE